MHYLPTWNEFWKIPCLAFFHGLALHIVITSLHFSPLDKIVQETNDLQWLKERHSPQAYYNNYVHTLRILKYKKCEI